DDGGLRAVGVTHGVTPYCKNGGVHPACLLTNYAVESRFPAAKSSGEHSSYLTYFPFCRAPAGERQEKLRAVCPESAAFGHARVGRAGGWCAPRPPGCQSQLIE